MVCALCRKGKGDEDPLCEFCPNCLEGIAQRMEDAKRNRNGNGRRRGEKKTVYVLSPIVVRFADGSRMR